MYTLRCTDARCRIHTFKGTPETPLCYCPMCGSLGLVAREEASRD